MLAIYTMARARILGAVGTACLVTACGTQSLVYHSADARAAPLDPSVVLLPPDVVVSLHTAGGHAKPRADWSERVSRRLLEALRAQLYERGVRFEEYGHDIEDSDVDAIRQVNVMLDAIELNRLKGLADMRQVGVTAIGGDRDYSLGEEEQDRFRSFGTDYALYVVLRANRASSGRVITTVLAEVATLGLSGMDASTMQFRSALIDLRDGHIKWANFDSEALSDVGDLLSAKHRRWRRAVDHLLNGFPL